MVYSKNEDLTLDSFLQVKTVPDNFWKWLQDRYIGQQLTYSLCTAAYLHKVGVISLPMQCSMTEKKGGSGGEG